MKQILLDTLCKLESERLDRLTEKQLIEQEGFTNLHNGKIPKSFIDCWLREKEDCSESELKELIKTYK